MLSKQQLQSTAAAAHLQARYNVFVNNDLPNRCKSKSKIKQNVIKNLKMVVALIIVIIIYGNDRTPL